MEGGLLEAKEPAFLEPINNQVQTL